MAVLFQTLVASSICWLVASSLWIYPHSLSYFNESIGGPLNGPNHLLGSNVDWGQDLRYVKSWVEKVPLIAPRFLVYLGRFYPDAVEINGFRRFISPFGQGNRQLATSIPSQRGYVTPEHGWYAISVSFLAGLNSTAYVGDGEQAYMNAIDLVQFQDRVPARNFGYSICLFRISDNNK